ncbi:putative major facilitator superfamily transporter [Massarina eburnea CBS 473.64]|uniref:Putative major facilitator superfamily transporter n=1 Tax=Massarina eburnea CBS 473.64 TaxID=1395130 RepID=A0A6A6RXU7_9PLEO|nr:putative major facilitator superfamily transporter [Massarina eburnea CBS 473.64]
MQVNNNVGASEAEGEVSCENGEERGVEELQPYTVFTPTQQSLLVYACSISAIFSTASLFIYFPAITAIAKPLHVSLQSINFTITFYQIVSGLAPSFFATLSDNIGRRPMLLFALTLSLGANLGVALTKHYVALVILRCLQSAGASSAYAIAYGVIADFSIPANRGSYIGVLLGFTNSAPCFGPRWIFWLLAITSGSHVAVLAVFLPETCRRLVGNGSVRQPHTMNQSLYGLLRGRGSHEEPGGIRISFNTNPFRGLNTLFDKANLIVVLVGGIQYTVFGCLATSLSAQVIHNYSLNYLTARLTYLPAGIGGMLAAILTGRLLDYEYRLSARKHNITIASTRLANFPIEEARLRSVFPFVSLSSAATVFVFVTCGTLLTDFNPDRSSTVQASYNLVRCTLSASGIAAVDTMVRGMGVGWCFTTFALFGASCAPLLYVLKKRGERWRSRAIVTSQIVDTEKVE